MKLENIYQIFEENGLGLLRDNKVRLVEHNENWSRVFEMESKRIESSLNIDSLKLFHCGSTAISGIVAKPIIDIVGQVHSLNVLDNHKEQLIRLGYEYKGGYGIEGRRFCVLYNKEKTIGYCHLHIYEHDSEELKNNILFTKYLSHNSEAAKEYEKVKKSLNIPRNQYPQAKSEVIRKLLDDARKDPDL